MQRRIAEPLGDRRARRHAHDRAEPDQQQQRAQRPAVDGPPPAGHRPLVDAREHHAPRSSSDRRPPAANRRSAAREFVDHVAEGVAAHFEIGELVVGGAGRRQQHDGTRHAVAPRRLARRRKCGREIAGAGKRHRIAERRRELLGRGADQIGVPDAVEIPGQRRNPAGLRQTAGDPVDRVVARQRLFGRIRVGRLRIVYIADAVDRTAPALAGARGRGTSGSRPPRPRPAIPSGARRGIGGGGVLPVVRSRQPLGFRQLQHPRRLAAGGVDQPAGIDIDAARRRFGDRDRHDPRRAGAQFLGDAAADRVVDADDRRGAGALAGEDAALGGDIARPCRRAGRDGRG